MTKEEMALALEDFKKSLPTYLTEADLQKSLDLITEKLEKLDMSAEMVEIKAAVEAQGVAMRDMNKTKEENQSLTKQLETNKELIKSIAGGVNKALVVRTDVSDNENAYDLPGIGQLDTAARNAYAVLPKIKVSESNDNGIVRYYDWDEATTVRAAAMVAEGAAFPSSTAKWKRYTLELEKIGDSIGYSTEMVEDSQMFAGQLGMFIETNVKIKENDQIINGDGTGTNLKGLAVSSTTYVPVAQGIQDVSVYDLVVDVRSDISKTTGGKYNVDVAFMNLTDIKLYKLKKDANNNYVMPPFYDAAGNRIDSVYVIEDNDVVADTMIVGDRRFAVIYEKTGYQISKGMVNNQFLEDEETLKIRKRLLLLIKNSDKTGFRNVTSIADALETLGQ